MVFQPNTNASNYISVEPNEYIEYKWFIYKKLWKIEKVDNTVNISWWYGVVTNLNGQTVTRENSINTN